MLNPHCLLCLVSHFGICYETQQTNTKIKMSKKGNQLIRGAIRGVFSQRTISEQSLIFDSIIWMLFMSSPSSWKGNILKWTMKCISLSFRFWNSVVVFYKFVLSSLFLPYYPLIVDFHPFLIDRVTSAASLALNLGADTDCLVNQMQNKRVLESWSTNIYQPQCYIMQVYLYL